MKKKSVAKLNLNNIVSIEGYASGENGNLYVSQVDDLTIFKGFKNEDKNGVKLLITRAHIPSTSKLRVLYGEYIIIIDKRFNKLSKKQKLALLAIENDKYGLADERLNCNYDAKDDSPVYIEKEAELSAVLTAMEKYGYRQTRKAIAKSDKFTMKSLKANGKFMYKKSKKGSKGEEGVKIETPINLQNA